MSIIICLQTVIWFQVFPSNTTNISNYMVSSNYSYLMKIIYLHSYIYIQVFRSNTINSPLKNVLNM